MSAPTPISESEVRDAQGAGVKPFLKWVGGKSQLLAQLRSEIPNPMNCYFEPFVGGGALFFDMLPKQATLIDTNEELINAYSVVRDQVEDLIEALKEFRYDSELFYQVRNADRSDSYRDQNNWTPLRRAARLIYLNRTCFNGLYRVNSRGQFNVPFGRYSNPTILDVTTLRACSAALYQTNLVVGNFALVETMATAGDFIYFDPPYVPLSDTASFTSYTKSGFGPNEQAALRDCARRLVERGVKVLISNSDTPLIRELYAAEPFEIRTVFASRAVNSKAERRGKVAEVLIRA